MSPACGLQVLFIVIWEWKAFWVMTAAQFTKEPTQLWLFILFYDQSGFTAWDYDKSSVLLIKFVVKQFWRWYKKITGINRIYDPSYQYLKMIYYFSISPNGIIEMLSK